MPIKSNLVAICGMKPACASSRFRPRGRKACRLLLVTALLLGWLGAGMSAAAKIPVAATILPLGDFCRQIGGDLVEVQVLIPPGASPHAFEPPPLIMARAYQARVFVYVGAGLEPWADRFLASRGTANLAAVEAVYGIPLFREAGGDHPGEESGRPEPGGHLHPGGNPHVWLDPILAQGICRRLAAALIQVDPGHRAAYEANLLSYLQKLEALDQEIRRQVSSWRLKDFVSFHPAFNYFARRYGLHQVGVVELAPGREPTPRHLEAVLGAIRRYRIRAVFAEPQFNPKVVQAIAREAGVKVLTLDPMGGRPPYGSDYLKLMRHNLAVMAEAMQE